MKLKSNNLIHRVCTADELETLTRAGWRVTALVKNAELRTWQEDGPNKDPYGNYHIKISKSQYMPVTQFLLSLDDQNELTKLSDEVRILRNDNFNLKLNKEEVEKRSKEQEKEIAELQSKNQQLAARINEERLSSDKRLREAEARVKNHLMLNEAILAGIPHEDWGIILSKLPQTVQDDLAPRLKDLVLNSVKERV